MSVSAYQAMLAGERYNCLDPELIARRAQAHTLFRQYNCTEEAAGRQALLHQLLGSVGAHSLVEPPFFCSYGRHITLGAHVFINFACTILDNATVIIGDHVMIGPQVQLYTGAHPLQADERIAGWETARPIRIEDNVWIGGGAIVLPGITVGRGAVIGAGAVVTHSVPAGAIALGVPARVVGYRPLPSPTLAAR